MNILCCPDKFRGSVSAVAAASALALGAERAGHSAQQLPLSDGGEGFLDVFGGANRTGRVTGPLGDTVEAAYRAVGRGAWIESAQVVGLDLVGGPSANDATTASSYGLGELVLLAVEGGAKRVVIGLGGSATTDGGFGMLRALHPFSRLRGVELVVACDVSTTFVDAARVFAGQKGASEAESLLLGRRLERLVQLYQEEYSIDVSQLPGSGAAGGLGGGFAAIGAELLPGFDLVAEEAELFEHIEASDAAITGEGTLDAESFRGKVVGGVLALATELGTPATVVAGTVDPDFDLAESLRLVGASGSDANQILGRSLAARYGLDEALQRAPELLANLSEEWCRQLGPR